MFEECVDCKEAVEYRDKDRAGEMVNVAVEKGCYYLRDGSEDCGELDGAAT